MQKLRALKSLLEETEISTTKMNEWHTQIHQLQSQISELEHELFNMKTMLAREQEKERSEKEWKKLIPFDRLVSHMYENKRYSVFVKDEHLKKIEPMLTEAGIHYRIEVPQYEIKTGPITPNDCVPRKRQVNHHTIAVYETKRQSDDARCLKVLIIDPSHDDSGPLTINI